MSYRPVANPIIALTRKCGSRLFFIGERTDGSTRFVTSSEALRLHKARSIFLKAFASRSGMASDD
jgi:hypothetical protein